MAGRIKWECLSIGLSEGGGLYEVCVERRGRGRVGRKGVGRSGRGRKGEKEEIRGRRNRSGR